MTAGCMEAVMGLGTNQNYGRGSCHPFAEFARPAKACLPLSIPCCYFKFSLAEENSAKSYCFRGIKRLQLASLKMSGKVEENSAKSYCFRGFKHLQSASLKMRGKCEMAVGLVVAVQFGSYLGLKSRGGSLPPVDFAGPAELCLFLLVPCSLPTSKPNFDVEIMAKLCYQFRILSKSENYKGCVTDHYTQISSQLGWCNYPKPT